MLGKKLRKASNLLPKENKRSETEIVRRVKNQTNQKLCSCEKNKGMSITLNLSTSHERTGVVWRLEELQSE